MNNRPVIGFLVVFTLAAVPISAILTKYHGTITIQLDLFGKGAGVVRIDGSRTSSLPPSH